MAKLSIFFLLCSLSVVLGNYYYYPGAAAGALSYMPYAQYGGYVAPYAVVAEEPECDKKEKGEESSSSESSSSESSEEGEKKEKKEKKEEKEEGEESKEGGEEKEEGEEKKEGEEKEEGSSSSSSSSEESKEKKEKKEKKEEKKKGKEEKYVFPPRTYTFPPVQQVVYAQSPYAYMQPYGKSYSVIQSAPVTYPVKSSYVAPYAAPAIKSYAPTVTKIISSAPAARFVSVPAAKSYSGYTSYLNPTSALGYPNYLGNNLGYYKA